MGTRLSRRAVVAAITAAGPAVLAACGGPQGAGGATPLDSTKPVKLEMATDWNSGTRMPVMEQMRKEFTEQHPHVSITHQYAPDSGSSAEGYAPRILAQMVAGTPPDVISSWWFYNHASTLVDLTRDAPLAGYKKERMVYHKDLQEIDGKLYMLSMNSTIGGWVYNKNLFQEAGIKDPDESWTMDDVTAAAQKLTRREKNQWGLELKFGPEFGWLDQVWSAGAGTTSPTSAVMFEDKTKKSRLAEGGGPGAFELYIDWVHKYRVAPTAPEISAQGIAFNKGNVGLRPIGIYKLGGDAKTIGHNFQWSVMPTPMYPGTKKRAYSVVQEGFVVARASQQRGSYDAALRYALSFYNDTIQKAVAESRGTLPIVKKWIESKEYLDAPPQNLNLIPKMLADKSLIVGTMQNWSPKRADWDAATKVEYEKAYRGDVAARAALLAAMQAGDRVLAG